MLDNQVLVNLLQTHYFNVNVVMQSFEREVSLALQAGEIAIEKGEEPVIRIYGKVYEFEDLIQLFLGMHFMVPDFINGVIGNPQEENASAIRSFFERIHCFLDKFEVEYPQTPWPLAVWLEAERGEERLSA